MAIPAHFMISDCDGGLYDTRQPDWSAKPLRPEYAKSRSCVSTCAAFKSTLRAGPFAWPGGYPLYFICDDGGALSFESARANARLVLEAIHNKDSSGWRIVACEVNWEDSELLCDHSGKPIPSAYGES